MLCPTLISSRPLVEFLSRPHHDVLCRDVDRKPRSQIRLERLTVVDPQGRHLSDNEAPLLFLSSGTMYPVAVRRTCSFTCIEGTPPGAGSGS